ncbi:Aluminum-activated malate transporter protein [Dioscorea alata]|uniref:Aluminum-activated malate transporter protein n=1 Tax=Dioscorea alata TaxID=55571 RepID=A0ACB7WCM5_DIOAL|nr:Aluminum-activated malate transporter protein [Dioscorea alata]
MVGICTKMKKLANDDHRRLLHSFKVGIALTLVSTLYYVTPIFKGFGSSTIWAVLTVVLVMEFTVGGTLTKGLNRAMATLLAVASAFGAHHVAILTGGKGEVILLGIFIFLIAVVATFLRFIPVIKARYDYGVLIFMLTFSLVAVSSFRNHETFMLAYKRLMTIAIGVAIALLVSVLVFPIWAGEDLHLLTATNLERLAGFLEGFGAEYFGEKVKHDKIKSKALLQTYKSVLNTKATEDSLANLGRLEPRHGRFRFRHPWKQYQKIGSLCRRCAYLVEALSSYIIRSESQAASELENNTRIRDACMDISKESRSAIKVLASSVKTMTTLSDSKNHMTAAAEAAKSLKMTLSEEGLLIREALHIATIVSLLLEIVSCAQDIEVAIEELAKLAGFEISSDQGNDGLKEKEKSVSDHVELEGISIVVLE